MIPEAASGQPCIRLSARDVVCSLATGSTAGFIGWRVLEYLGKPSIGGVPLRWLVVLVPCLWMLGIGLGSLLSTWLPVFDRFGRFAAIGFTNFAVEAGVTNLLMAYSGITSGWVFSGFKTFAYLVAFLHSYLWNKFWAFESRRPYSAAEFLRFSAVALAALLINVGMTSLVVNLMSPVLGASPRVWANLGIVAGSAAGMLCSFVGFQVAVFGPVKREVQS